MKISVVIPCYNSSNTIKPLTEKLDHLLDNSTYEYEIILIDDGSSDGTYSVIHQLSLANPRVIAKRFSQNYGQHAALMAAYRLATGDVIVGLNDDMEHDPKDIFRLIDKINEGYDYVCSTHRLPGHSRIQKLGSKLNNYCYVHLLNQPQNFYFSSFYAMNSFLVKEIIKNKNPFLYINGIILQITKNVTNVEIPSYKRRHGKSGYSLKKSIRLWLNATTSFSIYPLRLSGYVGIILLLLAAIGFVLTIIFHALNKFSTPQFWLCLLSIISSFQGVVLIFLALLGEYIGRSYLLINGTPQFTLYDEKTTPSKEDIKT